MGIALGVHKPYSLEHLFGKGLNLSHRETFILILFDKVV